MDGRAVGRLGGDVAAGVHCETGQVCELLRDEPAYLVCLAGADGGGDRVRDCEDSSVERWRQQEDLDSVQDWSGLQRGHYLGKSGDRGSGGWKAAAGRERLLGCDLGSGVSGLLGQDGGYLVRRGGDLGGGRQPARDEGEAAGQQVSGGPGQQASRQPGRQGDYLAERELELHVEQGERRQAGSQEPGQLARAGKEVGRQYLGSSGQVAEERVDQKDRDCEGLGLEGEVRKVGETKDRPVQVREHAAEEHLGGADYIVDR